LRRNNAEPPMSQMGHSRRFWHVRAESASPRIATGQRTCWRSELCQKQDVSCCWTSLHPSASTGIRVKASGIWSPRSCAANHFRQTATTPDRGETIGWGNSVAPCRLDRGDINLPLAHHRIERALCFVAAGSQRLDQHARRDLPEVLSGNKAAPDRTSARRRGRGFQLEEQSRPPRSRLVTH